MRKLPHRIRQPENHCWISRHAEQACAISRKQLMDFLVTVIMTGANQIESAARRSRSKATRTAPQTISTAR